MDLPELGNSGKTCFSGNSLIVPQAILVLKPCSWNEMQMLIRQGWVPIINVN